MKLKKIKMKLNKWFCFHKFESTQPENGQIVLDSFSDKKYVWFNGRWMDAAEIFSKSYLDGKTCPAVSYIERSVMAQNKFKCKKCEVIKYA